MDIATRIKHSFGKHKWSDWGYVSEGSCKRCGDTQPVPCDHSGSSQICPDCGAQLDSFMNV